MQRSRTVLFYYFCLLSSLSWKQDLNYGDRDIFQTHWRYSRLASSAPESWKQRHVVNRIEGQQKIFNNFINELEREGHVNDISRKCCIWMCCRQKNCSKTNVEIKRIWQNWYSISGAITVEKEAKYIDLGFILLLPAHAVCPQSRRS